MLEENPQNLGKVIGVGALNYDYLYRVNRIAGVDEEVEILKSYASPGGSAANTIYALAKLNLPTGFLGCVGDDANGKRILRSFKDVNVDTSKIKKTSQPSGRIYGFVDARGERELYIAPGANNEFKLENADLEYARNCAILHFSSFVAKEQLKVQKLLSTEVRDRISVTVGALYARRGLSHIKELLRDIVFLNQKELRRLTGKNYVEGCKDLLRYATLVVVTLGEGGCYIADKEGSYKVATRKIKPVDTTGAGDAFAAGFLYGLLTEKPPEVCGRYGNKLAGECVKRLGARSGFVSKI